MSQIASVPYRSGGVGLGWAEFGILLGVGGFEMGAFGEPGPGVELPGVHGAVAAVADVPGAAVDDVVPVVEGPVPVGLAVELVEVPVPVEVPLPVVLVVPGVVLDALAVPVLVPPLDGVQGATVFVVPELLLVVP